MTSYYTSAPAPAAAEPETAGLTRWQAPSTAPQAATTTPTESSRVVGAAVQFIEGQEQVRTTGTARHIVSHSGTAGGGLMATLQIQGAGHRTVELEPGNASSRTRVEVAVRQGRLREVSPGRFEDVAPTAAPAARADAGATEQAAADEQDTDGPGTEAFDAKDVANWDAAIGALPQFAVDAAASSATLAAVVGGDLVGAVRSLSANTGMHPEQARAYVEAGAAVHERAVATALAPMGLEGDRLQAFYASAREKPAQLQDAVQKLLHQRDTSGFRKMAGEFVRQNPGDLSMWTKAGFETHVGQGGELLLKREGSDWVRARDLK